MQHTITPLQANVGSYTVTLSLIVDHTPLTDTAMRTTLEAALAMGIIRIDVSKVVEMVELKGATQLERKLIDQERKVIDAERQSKVAVTE